MLLAIDHGNKQIKTIHCPPFVSGLQQSITKPFGEISFNVMGPIMLFPINGFPTGRIKRRTTGFST